MTMMARHCGEVWETPRVFQGAVGKSKTFPWPRNLSATVGSERQFTPPTVSKSLTRSVSPRAKRRMMIHSPNLLMFKLMKFFYRVRPINLIGNLLRPR